MIRNLFLCFIILASFVTAATEDSVLTQYAFRYHDINEPGWIDSVKSKDENVIEERLRNELLKETQTAKDATSEMAPGKRTDDSVITSFQISIDSIIATQERLWDYLLYKSATPTILILRKKHNETIFEYLKKLNSDSARSLEYIHELNYQALKHYNRLSLHERDAIQNSEETEFLFVRNKNAIDIAKSKHSLTTYLPNYAFFHNISDSALDGTYIGNRLAVNWQISIQYPIAVWRHYNTGVFFCFTSTGCFDLTNKKDSYPVLKRAFMPGAFGRLDMLRLWCKYDLDQMFNSEVEAGVYHNSNGGSQDLSRGALYIPYGSFKVYFLKRKPDSRCIETYDDQYYFTWWAKYQQYYGIEDNPDLEKQWGRFETQASSEFVLFPSRSFLRIINSHPGRYRMVCNLCFSASRNEQ